MKEYLSCYLLEYTCVLPVDQLLGFSEGLHDWLCECV